MTVAADLTGTQFGSLIAVSRTESDSRGRARWICRCVCGNTYTALAQSLKQGLTRSCGCRSGLTPVGSGVEPLYSIWAVDGPQNGIAPSRYGFCEVVEIATGSLLYRSEPVARPTFSDPSPNARKGLNWLAGEDRVPSRNNLTWRQWLIAARCVVITSTASDTPSVNRDWEQRSGLRVEPEGAPLTPAAPAEPIEPPTPEFVALMAEFDSDDPDDGADHMERYPISPEARAEMALQEARHGGQSELLAARLRASKARID